MATTGVADCNFGAFTAGVGGDVVITVTGQGGILAGSFIEAWVMDNGGTSDHPADEHACEALQVVAENITAGVGFQIRVICTNGPTYGHFNIAWVWN